MATGPIRVLMVGRYYWPHLYSDVACRTVRLADGLARAGIDVEVLTPRYASSWPDEIYHREIVVHRPAAAPRSDWSMGRYLRHVESWLREHAKFYDVIYCASLREEAALTVEAARRVGSKSILHHSGTGSESDISVSLSIRHRRRVQLAVQSVDAIVVSRASAHQMLLSHGLRPDRIHRISNGVTSGKGIAGRDVASRLRSRQGLATVNGDLSTGRDSLVIVNAGAMCESSGTLTLAQTIPNLIDAWPDLRFWLIGDGPLRNELHRFFKHHSVRQNVAMPGTFVDLNDVFTAADIYVQPSANDALDDFVPQAIASALPLVMVDAADTRAIVGEYDECISWCSTDDTTSLHLSIRRLLVDLTPAQLAAERLRRELLQRTPYSQTINNFVKLLVALTGKSIKKQERMTTHTET